MERKVVTTLEFKWERATKNTHRFKEVAPDGEEVVGVLYIQKRAIESTENGKTYSPSKLYVTIEA